MNEHPVLPSQPLTESEIDERFASLQAGLADHWTRIKELNTSEQTIVVVPSISLEFDIPATVLQAYEERFLFILLLLRQPRARMIYVTSRPVSEDLVDYFLGLLPGVIARHARKRLQLIATGDGSARPLTEKLLARPRVIASIADTIEDRSRAHLVPFNTTPMEKELAVRLGIPMFACDPVHDHHGSKTGSRRIFDATDVQYPIGADDLGGRDDLLAALTKLRAAKPELASVVIKLDESVSGEGNAVLDLDGLPAPGSDDEQSALEERLGAIRPEQAGCDAETFLANLAERRGIVEERIVGDDFRSPSVQLRITPVGEVQVLSTHDQLLGGPSGQSYIGCRFPADPEYALTLAASGRRIGEHLAREGVLGRFAVDFVTVRKPDESWDVHAIEINLRKGGTTHPYLTLEFLTSGRYDAEAGLFKAPNGRSKFYVADDHVEDPSFQQLTPDDVFDFAVCSGLHFDHSLRTGIVWHLLSCITQHGRLGLTAVGNTPEEAEALRQRAIEGLRAEAQRVSRGG
ncbi:MAG: peptide ligase PGM1-related protein [Acidobacteriota bacterium]